MLRVLNLNIIVDKNYVYSLSHFSVCSAKVKSLICRKWTWLLEKIEMEQSVALSVVRPRVSKRQYLNETAFFQRVSKWPYLNVIYVAKHHLWHQSWRSSWLWHLDLRTLNCSLESSSFGGKSFYLTHFHNEEDTFLFTGNFLYHWHCFSDFH